MSKTATPPFKNSQNQRYTKQLFWEEWRELPVDERLIQPPFTLNMDKEGYVNFGREYVNDQDPSGYTTSTRLLGDFAHWKYLLKAKWFREAVETWNEELDAKLYASGMRKIRELANSDDRGALVAAKFLVQEGYKDKDKVTTRGRPSKAELVGNMKNALDEARSLEDDAIRIGLVSTK